MDNLVIEATESTPFINFKADVGFLEMKGRSIPEDATAFYYPIFDWLNSYVDKPAENTVVHFYLEYINSISQKMLIDIFLFLSKLYHEGHPLEIIWFHDEEDEEIREEGNVFRTKLNIPIELKVGGK